MTELKTLKDFDFLTGVQQKLSKEEIIRWIKALRKKETNRFCLSPGCLNYGCMAIGPPVDHKMLWVYNLKNSEVEGSIKILKFIFNITDEDLK